MRRCLTAALVAGIIVIATSTFTEAAQKTSDFFVKEETSGILSVNPLRPL